METYAEKSRYWRRLHGENIQCVLCSHVCTLSEGEFGHCGARQNIGGQMNLPFYANISSIAIDPIEKKPLRRFLPGTWTYSVGFWHCSMDCPFCQNWEIAHPIRVLGTIVSPERLISQAEKSGCPSISFTYSEPTIHIEYVVEAMKLAHERGLKTILVTNGNLLPDPAKEILELTDATNIDYKASQAKTYKEVLGGNLKVVQNFIQIAHQACHTEVTSLAVPGILDNPAQIDEISHYLASISPDIPLHITRYHPAWHYHEPPLSSTTIIAMKMRAERNLKYVYAYV